MEKIFFGETRRGRSENAMWLSCYWLFEEARISYNNKIFVCLEVQGNMTTIVVAYRKDCGLELRRVAKCKDGIYGKFKFWAVMRAISLINKYTEEK